MWEKRFFIILVSIIFIFFVTGCQSDSSDKESLFKTLQDENIISKDLKLVDVVLESWGCGEINCNSKYYIYEDETKNLIGIKYETFHDKFHAAYEVTVYSDVTLNDDYNPTESIVQNNNYYDKHYMYSDIDFWTYSKKYNLSSDKKYKFNTTKSIVSNKEIFEK